MGSTEHTLSLKEGKELYYKRRNALEKELSESGLSGNDYKFCNATENDFDHLVVLPLNGSGKKLKHALAKYPLTDQGENGYLVDISGVTIHKGNETKHTNTGSKKPSLKPTMERAHNRIDIPGFLIGEKGFDFTYCYFSKEDALEAKTKMHKSGLVDTAKLEPDHWVTYTMMTQRDVTNVTPKYQSWVRRAGDTPTFRLEVVNFVLEHGFGINATSVDPETGFTKRIRFNKQNLDNTAGFVHAQKLFRDSFGFQVAIGTSTEMLHNNSLYISLLPQLDNFLIGGFHPKSEYREVIQKLEESPLQKELKKVFGKGKLQSTAKTPKIEPGDKNAQPVKNMNYDTIIEDVKQYVNRLMIEIGVKRPGVNLLVQKIDPKNGKFRVSLNTKSLSTDEKKSAFEKIVEGLPVSLKQYLTTQGATLSYEVPIEEVQSAKPIMKSKEPGAKSNVTRETKPPDENQNEVKKSEEQDQNHAGGSNPITLDSQTPLSNGDNKDGIIVDTDNITSIAQSNGLMNLEDIEMISFETEEYQEIIKAIPSHLRQQFLLEELANVMEMNIEDIVLINIKDAVEELIIRLPMGLRSLKPSQYKLKLKTLTKD
ncbi:hypothetical protein KC901_01070 [Patescibacteria group bacterium]|nr:hypothetical protein [Patescibacteria group bacterium]